MRRLNAYIEIIHVVLSSLMSPYAQVAPINFAYYCIAKIYYLLDINLETILPTILHLKCSIIVIVAVIILWVLAMLLVVTKIY